MWTIERTNEVAAWIAQLDDDAKEAIYKNLLILRELGPSLGRPYVDTINDSKHKNMKELRVQNKIKDFSGSFLHLPRIGMHSLSLVEIKEEINDFISG